MEALITGPAAAWLASRREDLNRRFLRASRRHPQLSADAVKAALESILPALAGDEPGADALCSAIFDLVLLHAGRGTLATQPGLELLLRETFPRLRPILLGRPSSLPGRLSNAVENLGTRGVEMARGLAEIGLRLPDPERLLDAGAVLAWRLGEARLRPAALAIAARLPPAAAAIALGLGDWPDAAVALALAALATDAYLAPGSRIGARTLAAIGKGQADLPALTQVLSAPRTSLPWRRVATAGDFAGLGGRFGRPPLLLEGGDRYCHQVRAGDACFAVFADAFGAVCRPIPDARLAVRKPAREPLQAIARKLDAAERDWLTSAGVTSMAVFADAVAVTHADSHRIRVYVPEAPVLP
jgi:hypothetical protein